jgi:large conductance mechanosensitive channel
VLNEFKSFIMRGNVLDLAVAVIIGGAFGAVVNSLVNDIIMPMVGRLTGGVDFSNMFINLSGGTFASLADAKKAGAATINYGVFINTIMTFLIVGFVMFMIIRAANQLQRKPAPTPTTKPCPYCKSTVAIDATRCAFCTSQL